MIKKTNFYVEPININLFMQKNKLSFTDHLNEPDIEKNNFFVDGNECKNEVSLYKYFCKVFNFIDGFGNNWDALNDSMSDFYWFKSFQFKIFIVNPLEILSENESDKEIFWEILSELDKLHPEGNQSGDEEIYLDYIIQIEPENLKSLEILLAKHKIIYNLI